MYVPGQDFSIPKCEDKGLAITCDFVTYIDQKVCPDPTLFRQAAPEDAEVFLFPIDAARYLDTRNKAAFEFMLRTLHREYNFGKPCILCDSADSHLLIDISELDIDFCYFKVSLPKEMKDKAFPFSYKIPQHVLENKAEKFSFDAIQYDVSFVGNMTSTLRKYACLSIQHERSLRSKIEIDDRTSFRYVDGVCYIENKERSVSYEDRRQILYRRLMKKSLCVLCPPGIGPQSFRFFETLFYGRIPVVFDIGLAYPFEEEINYRDFSLVIPTREVAHTGEIIAEFVHTTSREELQRKCIQSRKVYDAWFCPEKRLRKCLDVYLKTDRSAGTESES